MNDDSFEPQGESEQRGLSYAERRNADWPRQFLSTRGTLVGAAAAGNLSAKEELCCRYWYPVYAHVRRKGRSQEDAEDITQAFIASFLGSGAGPATYDPDRGKFRTYLLGALDYYLSDLHDREIRQKRGGGQSPISFDGMSPEDRYKCEPTDGDEPARAFQRRCVMEDLDYALHTLEADYKRGGEIRVFESLKPLVLQQSADPQERVAAELGITVDTLRVRLHRLKVALKKEIIADLTRTGVAPDKMQEEIAAMISLVST